MLFFTTFWEYFFWLAGGGAVEGTRLVETLI